MYINFQQNQVKTQVITVHTTLFAINRKLHKYATINNNFFFKLSLSDMHHHKTYMHINFQQNRRSVKNRAHKFICKKNCKLHKFATTYSNFEKKSILLDMHHHKTHMYINFHQNQVITQVMTVHTSLFAKNRKFYKC